MFDKLKKIVFGQPDVSQERSADHELDRLEEMLGSAKQKENGMLVKFTTHGEQYCTSQHRQFKVGLAWDEISSMLRRNASDIDLDLGVIGYDKHHNRRAVVYWAEKNAPGITYPHDNRTGQGRGDDEVIYLNFDKIDPNIEAAYVVLSSFSGHHFNEIKNLRCTIYDCNERPLVIYTPEKNKVLFNNNGTLILGKFMRKENNTQVVFQTIQSGVDGRTAKSCTIPLDL